MELTYDVLKHALREVIEEELGLRRLPALARKWEGGTVMLRPADESLRGKEIPIDTLFKKVTAVRERLRLLEQKINNHKNFTVEERAEFQDYLTRAYGSLTTFNVLFQDEEDRFTGTGG
ncbi:MAG: hypothetical protein GY851_17840 [bacterium]|nr:hypothetical protein [bacterium]